jgi:RecB family exonuclease
MTPRLKLYRCIEDAWNDGVRDWLEGAAARTLAGRRNWMIVANRGQIRWLRQKSLAAGITTVGVRYLDPHALRREMCAMVGLETVLLDGATLEFVLRISALRLEDVESRSVARNPSAYLRAMEELAFAGVEDGAIARELGSGYAWAPGVDAALAKSAAPAPLACCCVGWDAANWEDANLLSAAVAWSKECELYVAMPRSVDEKLHQEWIGELEDRLGVASTECTAGDFKSANEELVERLEGADLGSDTALCVDFLIGQEWADEMNLVRDDVIAWLASSRNDARLAVIAPRRSASSIHLVRLLTEAGIAVLDETGARQEPPYDVQLQREIVRYHLLDCDVDALLGFIALLARCDAGAKLDPSSAQAWLRNRFSQVQSRNSRLLVQADFSPSELSDALCKLVSRLGSWPAEITWPEARSQWETILREFEVTTAALEPLWSQTVGLLDKRRFPPRAFLEYLEALLSGSQVQPVSDKAFARVIFTTFSKVHHQSFDRILLLDSNETIWPLRHEENPFLDDQRRAELNRRRKKRQGRLLLSFEHGLIEQARFLDLIENCAGGIAFAATARDAADASREASLNSWATRVLAEMGSPVEWRKKVRVTEPAGVNLPPEEAGHLTAVHESRRNPCMPFDRYHFNLHECTYEAAWWNASKLDDALACPATFALSEILGVESGMAADFERKENWAVGILTHRWLTRALGGKDEFARIVVPKDLDARIMQIRKAEEEKLADVFRPANLPLPLWWRSVLHKAAWAARACASAISKEPTEAWFAMEKDLRAELQTDSGGFKVRGRIDLMIADREALDGATLKVIDFKTGKQQRPTLTRLRNGTGLQFAAYHLMARALGALIVRTSQVNPERGEEEAFGPGDEAELRAAMGRLALLQRDLKFGQAAPARSDRETTEELPMATTPIDPRILEAKAELLLIAQ